MCKQLSKCLFIPFVCLQQASIPEIDRTATQMMRLPPTSALEERYSKQSGKLCATRYAACGSVSLNKIWKLRINRTTFNRLKTKSTFKLERDAEPRQRSGTTLPTTSKESNSARQSLTATRSPDASPGDTNAYQQ